MKVKIFSIDEPVTLECKINDWIENKAILVRAIKIHFHEAGIKASAVVLYTPDIIRGSNFYE